MAIGNNLGMGNRARGKRSATVSAIGRLERAVRWAEKLRDERDLNGPVKVLVVNGKPVTPEGAAILNGTR